MSIQWLARMYTVAIAQRFSSHWNTNQQQQQRCYNKTWICCVQAKRPLHSCKRSAFLSVCCYFFLLFCTRELWSTIEIFFFCYYFALNCTFVPLLKQTKFFQITRFRILCAMNWCVWVCVSVFCTMFYYYVFLLGWFRRFFRFLFFFAAFTLCVYRMQRSTMGKIDSHTISAQNNHFLIRHDCQAII